MKLLFCCLLLSASLSLQAQHHAPALAFEDVMSRPLSDSLGAYRMVSRVMDVPPGFRDTVAHYHDADLFGYVLKGTVAVGLRRKAPEVVTEGRMFHEPRMTLHSLLENRGPTPACILLLFIVREGGREYIPAR